MAEVGGPRGPTEERPAPFAHDGEYFHVEPAARPQGTLPLLDLKALEARHPATVVLEAGEHHSQDVRERIQTHVDVQALLAHCRALVGALELARPFVIQYGTASELQQIETALDGITDEP